MTSMTIYDCPEYYDIAFSYRSYAAEVKVMREVIRRFSRIPVQRVLEIACGHCPHAPALVQKGYSYVGIDRSDAMLEYARGKTADAADGISLVNANLASFTLDEPVDFAFVMLGSLYVRNTTELESHFDAMGRALKPGGLYLLDWVVDFDPLVDVSVTWKTSRDGIEVKTSYYTSHVDRSEQVVQETVFLEVNDNGDCKTITSETLKRAIYPQEFLCFLKLQNDFEFVGWWNEWDLDKPMEGDEPSNRPIIVIRRK
jgi:SAM-dependent methyltransferase